jgi:hypothetical protein
MKHVRLPAYDASELDRLSYSNGVLVNDTTNATIRYMDGETLGGFQIATQDYVQTNAITSGNLATNLATALQPYALTSALAEYATTTALNSAISAIPIYSLPIATNSLLGGVKVDGTSITINPTTGVISGSNQYSLPIATASILGGVKPDGTTITINPTTGVISGANTYTLPAATTTVRGGVIIPAVGTSGINNTTGTIGLATASTTQLGGVKVDGTSITINGSGVISGSNQYVLPAATTTALGGVIVPAVANSGLTNTSGTIRLATATTNQLGGVKVDGVTITINGSGVIAANITGAIVFQGGWSAATNTPTLSNASSAYNTNGFEFVVTAAGTVNFGLGNVTFAVGDNVIYDGVKWVKIPIGSSAGTVNSLLTVDNSGTGDISGTTFNGSNPITISYNSIGASPLIGSSSLTTVGTIGTGTWSAGIIDSNYGGTGINNAGRTLTISGSSRTLDQDVASGSSPTFTGTNFSGTASSLTAGTATTATTAANITGGIANQIAYQTAADTTSFITAASGTNSMLQWTGSAFTWSTTAPTATNVAGGTANQLVIQTGVGATGFVVAPTVTNTYLRWNGSAFVFSTVTGATGGTVTSIATAGSVSGITLTGGTITTSGTITLGGTLSLVSPGAIGGTTASTGRFTTVQSVGTGSTTSASGQVYLNGATSNRIDYNTNGVAAPTFNAVSAGAKIVLYPNNSAASADYAIGIEGSTMWFGTPTTGEQFRWYGGVTNVMTLTSAGVLSASRFTSTVATGTAPFTVSSTTNVANLNASSLSGATFAAPGAIGSGTASTGAFTTVTATTSIKASGTGGIGYNTGAGAGGAVTQLISRTTGVTLNTITGRITLINAAGDTAQWLSFTVTNSTVAAVDTVIVNGDTATNRYIANVSNVAAGSFEITYYSFGTAIDQPTFNFAVIKGSSN